MAKVITETNQRTAPRWMGDFGSEDNLMRGGAQLDAVAFNVAPYVTNGKINVPSGTLVGRSAAERDAGAKFGPADAADVELYFTAFDCTDIANGGGGEFTAYRPYNIVKTRFLPAVIPAPLQTKIEALYLLQRGAEGNGQ